MALLFAQIILGLSSVASASPCPGRHTALKPSIKWRSCPEIKELIQVYNPLPQVSFDCGSLEVPLDYAECDDRKLNLDLFRVNATKEPVLGTVLWNPGGPGGTGAESLPFSGSEILSTLGGQFNVISWDPRGSGKTLPFDCKAMQILPHASKRAEPHLASTNLTEYFLGEGWETAVAYAEACYNENKDIGQLIGTPYTARDMLEIVNALDEGGLLKYWGVSYGTILGDYFAAMFPDRVERMLLDGNVNPHDYQAGHEGDFLQDTDKALNAFLSECIRNSQTCALASTLNASTPAEIISAVNARLLEPLASVASNSTLQYLPLYLTKGNILSALYSPSIWPLLADIFSRSLLTIKPGEVFIPDSNVSLPIPPYNVLSPNGIDGIRCSDAIWSGIIDPLDILDQVKHQSTVSPSFSDTGYTQTWACAAWKIPAKEQYKGNFVAKPSFPILYVNGLFDPVTPDESARNASKGFEGSRVLLHNGYGHSLIADPSSCVKKYVRDYFVDGTLPKEGKGAEVCEPDLTPWELYAKFRKESGLKLPDFEDPPAGKA